jgi:RND family efflux transporter MFP subunit
MPAVLVVQAERREAPALVRRGTVSVGSRFRLGFSIPGVLASVCCRTGDKVRQGQILATLRGTEADARLRAANAMRSKATRDFSNSSALVESGALAPNLRDEARDQLDAAEAQTALASEVLRLTKLVSPVTGTVQQRLSEPGETVGPAMPVLLVEEVGRLVVRVGLTQSDLARVAVGSPAVIVLDGRADALDARVANVAPVPDATDGLFSVEVRPDGKPTLLLPGALVSVRFREQKSESRVRIPLDALVERVGQSGVYVLESEQSPTKAKFLSVSIHRVEGKDVWIAEGLSGGERIVAEGAYFLEDGAMVRVLAKEAIGHGR